MLKALLVLASICRNGKASQDANRLLEDLFMRYNRQIRPVRSPSDAVQIQFKLKLLQIITVHEKDQVLTTSGCLIHEWEDYRLRWEPLEYGNVTLFHVPGELIWLPDIILYNNAHGSPAISAVTKADIHHSGKVVWHPPFMYHSLCKIDTKWFPYDEQHCDLKFGSWTYGGYELDMAHLDSDTIHISNTSDGVEWRVELGVDLSEFQESVEFDLLSAVGIRHEKRYPCCDYPAIDITYYLNVRRKKLFYTINLMTPCAGLAALIPVVFYLPSESHNKVMLCVSILVSLTVFFLVLIDTIPPTSIATPFIAKYLVFVMFMVTLSVFFTVVVLNLHNRQDQKQPPMLRMFIKLIGKYFSPGHLSKTPPKQIDTLNALALLESHFEAGYETGTKKSLLYFYGPTPCLRPIEPLEKVARTLRNLRFISHVFKEKEALEKHRTDWKHAAKVIDRFMLFFFTAFILGITLVTTLSAPSLRDNRAPLTTTANLLDELVLSGNLSDYIVGYT